jgi:regulator of protease activity HflC (stomatin/prohibitin superfamily)
MSDDLIRPRVPFDRRRALDLLGRLLRWLFRRKITWIAIGVLFLAWCGPSACTTYVPPNATGIKQVFYGSSAGMKKEPYGPGIHFLMPGVERMHVFPADLQLINFTDSPSESSIRSRSAPSIKIQTSDGYNVQLDVSLLYRIDDAYKVITESGPGRSFEDRLVVPRADRILRKTLGELNAEEFYQGPRRIEKSQLAHDLLKSELAAQGIAIESVLVRRYIYDGRYQQLIEGRKIKDQTVFLRQAEAKAAIEQRKRDTAIAEGKAQQEIELSRGRAEVEKLQAQADLYRRKKAAEGKLLVELAEAKGTQLENSALQGAGSENMVGLKMADVLKGVRVMVLSSDGSAGTNPLDLATTLRRFEVK